MKKISTLFRKDPEDLSRVINEVDPINQWALTEGRATRKFDGTACAIINGVLYKRYDAKKGKTPPLGSIPCQDPDPISGHWPHWVKVDGSGGDDKYFFEGYKNRGPWSGGDGTYELLGPRINGNREGLDYHIIEPHGCFPVDLIDRSFEGIRSFLETENIEGIVFHHPDGRMCKIRKSDYGLKREKLTVAFF